MGKNHNQEERIEKISYKIRESVKLIDIMDTQLLTFWNFLSFFLLLIALYFFRRNSSSKMAENSSKSIYDFTVKVPFFHTQFCLFIYFFMFFQSNYFLKNLFFDHAQFFFALKSVDGSMENFQIDWFYFSDLILFVICTTFTGYQWKWCESESIQREGSAGCQCCLPMVT